MSINSSSISLTSEKDIIYSGFKLHKNGLQAIGTPTFEQWQECGNFIKKSNGAVHFWIGDWLNYGEQKYGEMYSQALDETSFDYGTLRDDKWITSRIPLSLRSDNLSRSHAREIASLEPLEIETWANYIKNTPITVSDLKKEIKKETRIKLGKPKLPEGKYDVIYLDPPWQYSNSGISGAAENHYPTMSIEELAEIKIPSADNATMFIWVTNPILFEALPLVEKWGFKYKTNMVWVKNIAGQGFYVKGQHELLLICVKGNHRPDDSLYVRSVVQHPRLEHSQKPEVFYEIIEKLYPDGKYLEMFARNKRDGWTSWGNEI